eukprot:2624337-Amphidinium_carterae.1
MSVRNYFYALFNVSLPCLGYCSDLTLTYLDDSGGCGNHLSDGSMGRFSVMRASSCETKRTEVVLEDVLSSTSVTMK